MEFITVTDGYTLNPGDLSWDKLASVGTLNYFDRSPADKVLERCKNATIIVTNKTPINAQTIRGCAQLKIISVTATGYNIVDIDAAKERGVVVCNVPGYGTDSVAQHTFALILELSNGVGINAQSVRDGEWSQSPDFCYTKSPLIELRDKTLGIIGFGQIGQKVAEIARAFGMKVIYSRNSTNDPEAKPIEEVFSESDVVTLHCPLSKDNAGFVNEKLLSKMKSSSFLINTARGQLINESDLAKALRENAIKGAALDVLSVEPPPSGNPLVGLRNCIITPHNAWYSVEARTRIMETTYQNVVHALKGSSQNVVT